MGHGIEPVRTFRDSIKSGYVGMIEALREHTIRERRVCVSGDPLTLIKEFAGCDTWYVIKRSFHDIMKRTFSYF